MGAEWFPVQLWDISLKEEQCFRCLKWGHHQSLCNSPHEFCCKKKGHIAWEMSKCPEFKKFKDRNAEIKAQLVKKTAIMKRGRTAATPTYTFTAGTNSTAASGGSNSGTDSTEWVTVEGRKKRKVVGRPTNISKAAKQPGQSKLFHSQPNSSPDREEVTEPSTQ
ncbi:hypothetical protein GQ43DRAFT_467439 [Delitschia confertaspora ATCC 74209]|uniref:CCHC-type domain-containing protein n=1 Tax=Delitschia confertaspora ATCC 74209 TaxID=1513339 RepID=A0A9P4JBI8_9PLEO|nr:hypothetical protein GQ43DRAFT_467439 [Delitschia confertaspora ATCC 74209]